MKTLSLKLLGISLVTTTTFTLSSTVIAETTQAKTSQQQLQISQAEAAETGDIVDIASGDETFSILVSAVEAAELVETLQGEGPYTVFAPTNEAFEALPEEIVAFLLEPENQDLLEELLTYHVVEGNVLSTDLETGMVDSLGGEIAIEVSEEGVMANEATVIAADVEASNGTIHAIDSVLIPEGFLETVEARMAEAEEPEMDAEEAEAEEPEMDVEEAEAKDLVTLAQNEEDFSTLVAAVETAGLVETLQGEGPFTVFAPTDEAFDALPEGVLEFLLEPENQDLLERILTYHVVEGNIMSTDLETGSIESLGGGIAINVSEEGVKINNADVVQADVEASNGTVHIIDTVLAPAGFLQTVEERMN